MQILQPPNWKRPRGYANGVAASGTTICVSGMVGWDAQGQFQSDNFAEQTAQALRNIVEVLAQAGAKSEHIVRMTWYVIDKKEYLSTQKQVGKVYRDIIGNHYPAMSAIQVSGLMEDRARVEIEVTAILP
jgi:enamine deaminase RidA (YjgF/YER057c/UK114 family)